MKKQNQSLIGKEILKKYQIMEKIGTGAFGQIYRVCNKQNKTEQFAVKFQPITSRYPQLQFEAKLYRHLHNTQIKAEGIPNVYGFSMEGGYYLLVMDLLGQSLQDLFVRRKKKLSTKTILMIGLQMIDRLALIHESGLIHRDIKPDNMLVGNNDKKHTIFLVDFGLSKKYVSNGKHIGYRQGKQLTGTARYASINTHKGVQQSRRDDIESLSYVLMYFFRGILPWQNIPANSTRQKYNLIMKKKISTPLQSLCSGYPSEMIEFITYARKLKFDEQPDYSYLRYLLMKACQKKNIEIDYRYQWNESY